MKTNVRDTEWVEDCKKSSKKEKKKKTECDVEVTAALPKAVHTGGQS